ncbi:MAG: squalene--hopene cyclase, partial [Pirellulaceae bacterium]|nr:squalene--hopene cyclase [Pirellulaceae bacterium]
THQVKNEFQPVVAKGWKALLAMQSADGEFQGEAAYNQKTYAQAQASIALCEIYGMTKDKDFRDPAQKAVNYALFAQSPQGGWRYSPKEDSDTSVTGWYVMALQSAMMAGLDVPSPTFEKIGNFLDSVGSANQSKYAYMAGQDYRLSMTAEGLLCREYLGWKHDDERLRAGANYLLANPIDYNSSESHQNVYYWYYATQTLHHMGGDDWDKWNKVMRQAIPTHQVKSGPEKGSWAPSAGDSHGAGAGGRLYTTCLSIYMLEVYYRHLPIYKYRSRPVTSPEAEGASK